MKPLTHIVYLALIAALSVYAWSRSPSPEPVGETQSSMQLLQSDSGGVTAEPTDEQTPSVPMPNQHNNEMILALIEVNEQLQQQLEEVEQQLKNKEHLRERPRNVPNIENPLLDRLGVEPERFFTDPNYLTEFLEARPQNFERDAHLELLLNDSFVTNEALRNLQLDTLQCRSSVCVLEVDLSSLDSFSRSTLHALIHSEDVRNAGGLDSLTVQHDNIVRMIIGFQDQEAG